MADPLLLASVTLALGLGILGGPIGLYAVYALQPDTEVTETVRWLLMLSGAFVFFLPAFVRFVFPKQALLHALLMKILVSAVFIVAIGASGLRYYRCRA